MAKVRLYKRWYLRHRYPVHIDWGKMVVMSAGWAMLLFIVYRLTNS
jgi:hypothetical protein